VNPSDDVFVHYAFFFGPGEVAAIQSQAPAAWFVGLHMFVNVRVRNRSHRPVPAGYRCNGYTLQLLVEAMARASRVGTQR
jgi:hypothetical protein